VSLRRLLLVALILFAAGLGLRDPWPADEPRYALAARDMVLSGDWLIPRVGGIAYSDKPPLFMWAVAAAYAVFENLRIAALLPSLLAGLGVLVLVYDLARRLWGRQAAWLAALVLVLTVQFTMQARTAQIDALVCFWTTLGIYGLLRHLLLGPRWPWYFVAWFAMGLGIITKGVGFLPLLMLAPWAIVRLRWPQHLPSIAAPVGWWWAGPIVMLLAVCLWLVPMLLHVAGSDSLELARYRDDILLRQTAERYANAWHHVQPFWYFALEVIPWAWAPLSLLLPWLVPAWWRRLKSGDAATWMLLGWVACVLLFFSASPGKRGVYILPALPALALAAAPVLSGVLERRGVRRLAAVLLAVLALATMAGAVWLQKGTQAALWGFDLWPPVVAAVILSVALLLAARRIGALAALMLLIVGAWQLYGWWAAPLMNAARSGRELMGRVQAAMPPAAELGLVGWKEQFLLHVDRPVVHFGFRRDAAAEARDAAAWLLRKPERRLLISEAQMPPCFDAAAGEPLGERHRREWRLVGLQALTGACAAHPVSRQLLYDPAGGRILAAGEGEPQAAADQAGAREARDEAHALLR
jgi:4-amino-4-deoxy-L-arabinose transferase-like glycosyltransferase